MLAGRYMDDVHIAFVLPWHQVVSGSDMNGCKLLILLVRPTGFEPVTLCLEG